MMDYKWLIRGGAFIRRKKFEHHTETQTHTQQECHMKTDVETHLEAKEHQRFSATTRSQENDMEQHHPQETSDEATLLGTLILGFWPSEL